MSDAAALNVIKTHKSNISNSHRNHENLLLQKNNSSSSNNYDNSTINIHKKLSNESYNASSQNSNVAEVSEGSNEHMSTPTTTTTTTVPITKESDNAFVNSLDVDCDVITSDSR